MTDFNALPLAEKIKQAQAGDTVVTDSGARVIYAARDTDAVSTGVWVNISKAVDTWIKIDDIADIIRPTARKVPEVVEWLTEEIEDLNEDITATVTNYRLIGVLHRLAKHFEKETP